MNGASQFLADIGCKTGILDFLYVLGCETDISDERMEQLCRLLGVSWEALCNHSIKTANQ